VRREEEEKARRTLPTSNPPLLDASQPGLDDVENENVDRARRKGTPKGRQGEERGRKRRAEEARVLDVRL
jgi:hypothetical protein